jgi:hypothetical protein
MPDDLTTSIKTRAGEFFRSRLDMPEIHFFLNNAEADAPPPYGVVTVTHMAETTPGSDVFTADIKIAVLTSIDISSTAQHDTLLELVTYRLSQVPKRIVDDAIGIFIFGWVILYSETVTKEESQSFSDIFTIRLGCGG